MKKIEKIILAYNKILELIKEKKLIYIRKCVTKGLLNEINFKDSGLDWVHKIPNNWKTMKLKYVTNIIMGQSPDSSSYNFSEIGSPFLQGNAEFGELFPKPEIWCDSANKYSKKDDILLSVRAPVGAVNISDNIYGIGRGLCAIQPINIEKNYLFYLTKCIKHKLESISKGSTFQAIKLDDIKNIKVPIPPKREQQDIGNHLIEKTDMFTIIEKMISNQITLFNEYRKNIIMNVV
ncbi:MAG: restriction endonuclease subunit S, partial [Cyanobacteriota bacterium]|nr:restriction endonuclease subunit S [Cyanobacteriota bacterium]